MVKKIMLSIVSFCLMLCLILSFSACGENKNDNNKTNDTTKTTDNTETDPSGNPAESGSTTDPVTEPLTADEQKVKIAETISNLKLYDLVSVVDTANLVDNEIIEAADGFVNLIVNSVFNLGKKYSATISRDELNDDEEIVEVEFAKAVAAFGKGQATINVTGEGKSNSYNIVNKDGDVYFCSNGDVNNAMFVGNISEVISSLKGLISGENAFGLDSMLNMIPEDSLGKIPSYIGILSNFTLPEMTAEDLKTDGDFYYLDNDYLAKIINSFIDSFLPTDDEAVTSGSTSEITAIKMKIAAIVPMLNLHIGFQADAADIKGLLISAKPDNALLNQVEAPLRDVEFKFECTAEKFSLALNVLLLNRGVNYSFDEETGEPVVDKYVEEYCSINANILANNDGADGSLKVVIPGEGENPINVEGTLKYVAADKKFELTVLAKNTGLAYFFATPGSIPERDQVDFDLLIEGREGGFSMSADFGLEGYAQLIQARAYCYDAGFGANLYIDPSFAVMFGIPNVSVDIKGTVASDKVTLEKGKVNVPGFIDIDISGTCENGKLTLNDSHIKFDSSAYFYEPVWVIADRYEVDARVCYTECIELEGSFELKDLFGAKVAADLTLTHYYENISVNFYNCFDDKYNSVEPNDEIESVIKEKFEYDAQRFVLSTDDWENGSKIKAELQTKMMAGEHAGDFDTLANVYITLTVDDAVDGDFMTADEVNSISHEEGTPSLVDTLLAIALVSGAY